MKSGVWFTWFTHCGLSKRLNTTDWFHDFIQLDSQSTQMKIHWFVKLSHHRYRVSIARTMAHYYQWIIIVNVFEIPTLTTDFFHFQLDNIIWKISQAKNYFPTLLNWMRNFVRIRVELLITLTGLICSSPFRDHRLFWKINSSSLKCRTNWYSKHKSDFTLEFTQVLGESQLLTFWIWSQLYSPMVFSEIGIIVELKFY